MPPEAAQAHAQRVRETGFTLLPSLLPVELIDAWSAAFAPLLQATICREGASGNRGPHRYYVTLPFMRPWADPQVIDHPDITAVVDALLGPDAVMSQLATDTPLRGSLHQDLHRDEGFLFPETGLATPPYLLAVNIPLVDVTLENGPIEAAEGLQNQSDAESLRRIEVGLAPLRPVLMRRGDVMIRDVRHIHRGTPNRTDAPRPMVVMGYQRPWLFRPDVRIRMPRETWEILPESARRRLRFNPIVESVQAALGEEATILPPKVQGS